MAVDISVAFSIKTEHRKKLVHIEERKKWKHIPFNYFLKGNFDAAVAGDLMYVKTMCSSLATAENEADE